VYSPLLDLDAPPAPHAPAEYRTVRLPATPLAASFSVERIPVTIMKFTKLPDGQPGPLEPLVPPASVLVRFGETDATSWDFARFKKELHALGNAERVFTFQLPAREGTIPAPIAAPPLVKTIRVPPGPLGMMFFAKLDPLKLAKFVPLSDGSKGAVEASAQIPPGSLLLMVNDQHTNSWNVDRLISELQALGEADRTLTFQLPSEFETPSKLSSSESSTGSELLTISIPPGPLATSFSYDRLPMTVVKFTSLPDGKKGPLEGNVPIGSKLIRFGEEDASNWSFDRFKKELQTRYHEDRVLVFLVPPSNVQNSTPEQSDSEPVIPEPITIRVPAGPLATSFTMEKVPVTIVKFTTLANGSKGPLEGNVPVGSTLLRLNDLDTSTWNFDRLRQELQTLGKSSIISFTFQPPLSSAAATPFSPRTIAQSRDIPPILDDSPTLNSKTITLRIPEGPLGTSFSLELVPVTIIKFTPLSDGRKGPLEGKIPIRSTLVKFGDVDATSWNFKKLREELQNLKSAERVLTFKIPDDKTLFATALDHSSAAHVTQAGSPLAGDKLKDTNNNEEVEGSTKQHVPYTNDSIETFPGKPREFSLNNLQAKQFDDANVFECEAPLTPVTPIFSTTSKARPTEKVSCDLNVFAFKVIANHGLSIEWFFLYLYLFSFICSPQRRSQHQPIRLLGVER
jgi:hypothetical protein